MDFRSQLSAFQNGRGSQSNQSNNSNNRGYNTTPQNNSHNYYGRGGSDQRHGRGGDVDRRRGRPNNWNHQGPPHSRRRYQSPDRDGLGDLRRFGFNIPKGNQPLPTQEEKKKKKTKHIALLAITIGDLPYEHIWKDWLQTVSPAAGNKDDYFVSLVCHAKYPDQVKSEWLKQRLLVQKPRLGRGNSYLDPEFLTRKPEWGSVEITRAMIDLLEDAAKIGNEDQKDMRFAASRYLARRPVVPIEEDTGDDTIPPVDQFLFISETCLPVCTAHEFFQKVKDTTVSWVNARHRKDEGTPKNKYEDDQFAGINRRIPGQYRWKADQWVLLCRNHATQVLALDRPHMQVRHQLWHNFRNINASDEMYFPTTLSLLGLLRYTADGEDTQRARSMNQNDETKSTSSSQSRVEATVPEPVHLVLKKPITYTDWSEGMRNPACFTQGIRDFRRVIRLARAQGCLVARKFAPFVAVPGVANEDQKITGQITVEEWRQEVELVMKKDEEANPQPIESDVTNEEKVEANSSLKASEEASEGEQHIDDAVGTDEGEQNEDELNEEDDDQQENELE